MTILSFQNKRQKKLYLCAVVLFLLFAAFLLYEHYVNKQLTSYRETLTAYQQRFEHYLYEDYAYTYNSLIGTYQKGLDSKNLSVLKNCCKELDTLEASVINANTKKLQKKMKRLQKADVSNAYDNELKQLSSLQTEAQTLLDTHNFTDAAALIKKWSHLVKNMSFIADNLSISVKQTDSSSYPFIRLYLSIHDIETDQTPDSLEKSNCFLTETLLSVPNTKPAYDKAVLSMKQLDHTLPLSVTIAADMGNVKTNKDAAAIQNSISSFLESVQFEVNDQLELIAISDKTSVIQEFTSDKELLLSSLNRFQKTKNASHSSFYDGLAKAIKRASVNSGAKCVIAFTNGEDKKSKNQWEDIVALANQYSIPVYVIGIGSDLSPYILERISVQTNASYRNITNFSSLKKAFRAVYREMKQLYQIEYRSGLEHRPHKERKLTISYEHRLYGGQCEYIYKH